MSGTEDISPLKPLFRSVPLLTILLTQERGQAAMELLEKEVRLHKTLAVFTQVWWAVSSEQCPHQEALRKGMGVGFFVCLFDITGRVAFGPTGWASRDSANQRSMCTHALQILTIT